MQLKLASSLAVTLALALAVRADTIQAFSGSSCDGNAGNVVQCDSSCHQFAGRHSLRISGGGNHCVTFHQNSNCQYQTSLSTARIVNVNTCYNVNTGGPVNSFSCAPTTTCTI